MKCPTAEREREREKDRGSWRSCCHVLLFVCGRFHFIYSYSCRYSWSGSNRERRTGERPVERGLHENCLISPGAKMGNRVQATPTHTHTHTPLPLPLATPTWARISYFHIFAWPFATVFPAWQVEEPSPVGPGESTSVGVRIRPWIGIYFGFCAHKMHVADLDGYLGLFVVAPLQRCSFSCSCSCCCRWRPRCRYNCRYICEYRCVCVCVNVFDTLIVCLAHCLPPRDLFATWTLHEYFQLTAHLTRIYRLPPDCQQTWQKSRRVFW